MLSCGVLSHWPELLPRSCIKHLPAEQLFANAARDKHISHGENRRGKKPPNNKTNTKTWGSSIKSYKYQRQEVEIILAPARIKHMRGSVTCLF